MPGLTAWAGLFRLAAFREGDAVFVSGAAGAVGSLVGQFARLHGASAVIGSAGTPEKVRWLTEELGFTAAFDYHDGPVAEQLAAAAPDGIDVFFDNVGGEHLEAAIGAFGVPGGPRCAARSPPTTPSSPPPGPRNMSMLVAKRLSLRGFIVGDHADMRDGVHREGDGLADLRRTGRPGDRARGAGRRRPGVPGPPARRQHREDGRPAGRGRLSGV